MSTADGSPDSFTSAWSQAKFPPENRAFVEDLCATIGISGYRFVPGSNRYIAATRRDRTGELRVHSGYTTGFTETEAKRLGAGADDIRASTSQRGTWFFTHPVHGDTSLRGGNAATKRRESRRCPQCGIYELSLSGQCPGCDD